MKITHHGRLWTWTRTNCFWWRKKNKIKIVTVIIIIIETRCAGVAGEIGQPGTAAVVAAAKEGDRAGHHVAVRGRRVPVVQRVGAHIERGRGVLRHHGGPAGQSQQLAGHHQLVRELRHLRDIRREVQAAVLQAVLPAGRVDVRLARDQRPRRRPRGQRRQRGHVQRRRHHVRVPEFGRRVVRQVLEVSPGHPAPPSRLAQPPRHVGGAQELRRCSRRRHGARRLWSPR